MVNTWLCEIGNDRVVLDAENRGTARVLCGLNPFPGGRISTWDLEVLARTMDREEFTGRIVNAMDLAGKQRIDRDSAIRVWAGYQPDGFSTLTAIETETETSIPARVAFRSDSRGVFFASPMPATTETPTETPTETESETKPASVIVFCNGKDLISAFNSIKKTKLRKPSLPILGYLRFNGENGQLSVSMTDLDIFSTFTIEAESTGSFDTLIPIDQFVGTKAKPGLLYGLKGRVEFKVESGIVSVNGRKVYTWKADDYPSSPDAGTIDSKARINAPSLRRSLEFVEYSVGRGETRECLNGVEFRICMGEEEDPDSKLFRITSTDGRRLNTTVCGGYHEFYHATNFILPYKTVDVMLDVLKGLKGDGARVDVGNTLSHAMFTCSLGPKGEIRVFSRLLDGDFPFYREVVNPDIDTFQYLARVNGPYRSDEFTDALSKAYAVSEHDMAVLEIEPARGMVNVSATSADKGEVSQDIIVDFSQGDDKTQEVLRLGINARYLSDAIKSLSGEGSILLGFKGETRPVQIQWCDSVAVIMPMRLKGN